MAPKESLENKMTVPSAGSAKSTPEGEAESAMKKAFLGNARAQITDSNDGLHISDPKGDAL